MTGLIIFPFLNDTQWNGCEMNVKNSNIKRRITLIEFKSNRLNVYRNISYLFVYQQNNHANIYSNDSCEIFVRVEKLNCGNNLWHWLKHSWQSDPTEKWFSRFKILLVNSYINISTNNRRSYRGNPFYILNWTAITLGAIDITRLKLTRSYYLAIGEIEFKTRWLKSDENDSSKYTDIQFS